MNSRSLAEVAYDEVVDERDTSFCFAIGDDEMWIPKSVIHNVDEIALESGPGTVIVDEWFAIKQELV